jgi:endonuclease IV
MNSPRFNYMPLILETPLLPSEDESFYGKEIELLYQLVDESHHSCKAAGA